MKLQLLRMVTAPTVCWLLCLSLITDVSCETCTISDKLLTATEDSCVEIKCSFTQYVSYDVNAHWFWIKDPTWKGSDLSGTVVYSNKNTSQHPVSPDFKDRVTYTESSPTPRMTHRGILICNLKMSDNGSYSFRYDGGDKLNKWITKPGASLTVKKNPCPVTFEKPKAVIEPGNITLTCSTWSSCSSRPQITNHKSLTRQSMSKSDTTSQSITFEASWQDDGKAFSCQIENNTDKYLIKTINITVEYAPKNTTAQIISNDIKEGNRVTLKCSSSGRPTPIFQWFKDGTMLETFSGSEREIPSVTISDAGQYHCSANNTHGTGMSNVIQLDVKYAPRVEVIVESPQSPFTQGQTIQLSCNVITSNPSPTSYSWFKNQNMVAVEKTLVVKGIEPEDSEAYTCEAKNTAGTGRSKGLQMNIQYKPRNTNIAVVESQNNRVKIGKPLIFKCNTDANPAPGQYSWYRYGKYKQLDSSLWKSRTTNENSLHLEKAHVDDDACYTCNATNSIGRGDTSPSVCIDVLYPPTTPTLTMVTEVIEGQTIIIDCTVRSSPKSNLTLTRSSWQLQKTNRNNTLRYTFRVTSDHAGNYACQADNGEGSQSTQRMLLVKYRPKKVTVQASPGRIINENTTLKLYCGAESYPSVSSVTWSRKIDGKVLALKMGPTLVVKSVTPNDSGLYSCEARNPIGIGTSQPVQVDVRYAPKDTKVIKVEEQQLPDGTRLVMLKCSSHSYPPVSQFTWYMKSERGDMKMSNQQTYTVYSDQPGLYYCIAQNEIRGKMSEPEPVFMDRDFIKVIILALIILLITVIIFIVYRQRKKKYTQRRAANTLPWWSSVTSLGRSRRVRMPEAPRIRDDPLPAQPYAQNGQQSQHRPDNTGASNIISIYSTVNHPTGQESGSAQNPDSTHRSGQELDNALNYASLHFDKNQKKRHEKANNDVVYAAVSMSKPLEQELQTVTIYGNINEGHKGKSPNGLHYDTDTSEDEEDISYAQVNIVVKPGCKRNTRDSTSSDEEQIQYTEVKL